MNGQLVIANDTGNNLVCERTDAGPTVRMRKRSLHFGTFGLACLTRKWRQWASHQFECESIFAARSVLPIGTSETLFHVSHRDLSDGVGQVLG